MADFEKIEHTALAAAHGAAKVLLKYYGRARVVKKKGEIDLLTQADKASEEIIVEAIARAFPDHAILAEEGSGKEADSEYTWIVDPLDGTTNYAHGLPLFSISIGLARAEKTIFGLVLNPVTQELFVAKEGQGATLNSRPISVSDQTDLQDSLVVTGFPYGLKTMMPELMDRFSAVLPKVQGVRRLGSAALDLCYVACGRFDGFWEQNLAPWDTAAGECIVREAGGKVTDFAENEFSPGGSQILATNGKIHDAFLPLIC
ncbi:inositol monophosphatase family protein [Desulfatibacillum aliphaticivorans]|uniref:inositol monophosphatase family protein n=1 Tax=Desulfatibacillum aliphaticivorans TaxID=218208 RepID=UPI00041F9B5B|nr:inositol monophosphatase family protein [Desulfatibacillum aliphaticivorans]